MNLNTIELQARIIKRGTCAGEALVSPEPIGFLGGVDPETGIVIEPGHALEGQSITGRVLVFPTGKGSTVGSYVMLSLAKASVGPAGIICADAEPTIAVGAIISDIPMVDQVDMVHFQTGDRVSIEGEAVRVEKA